MRIPLLLAALLVAAAPSAQTSPDKGLMAAAAAPMMDASAKAPEAVAVASAVGAMDRIPARGASLDVSDRTERLTIQEMPVLTTRANGAVLQRRYGAIYRVGLVATGALLLGFAATF